ncbi:hypothetical protein HZY97_08405 [Sphingomonas sp. R-74633]|uniref:hypothetical protein n=1 Tax=Sphingomonas sp. R-74633 TaxID=2751188 RepID=UPI0015D2AA29|nr:hypothetical protein [Sphingomonas sp. R-74633]NYT40774.1 hypothetical protein [Sphingomonas sp. R-74633]
MTNESAPADMTADELNAIFRSLRALKRQHEKSMNDDELAELLIGAAIFHGFDQGRRITGALATLEMNRRHAGIILKRLTGVRWHRSDDGRYRLIV